MTTKTLKGSILALTVAALGALGACSTVTTSADYDKSTDFSKYKSYQWKDVDPGQNAILEKRIKEAVNLALSARGLKRVEDGADLLVVHHARLSKETQINSYNTGWGYGWGRWGYGRGMGTTTTIQEIPVGTLIVDLVDTKAREMVWRGTASRTLDPTRSPEQKEKALNAAVQKMFDGFPPKK
jgi:hypothetical protein